MLRLSYVSFRREAMWMMIVAALPIVAGLIAVVVPALARWLGWR